MSLITAGLSLALFIQTTWGASLADAAATLKPERDGAVRILLIMAALIVCLFLLDPLGFRLSLFLFLLFLPFALGAHWLWLRFRYARVRARADAGDPIARQAAPPAPPGPWPLVAMVVISPLVFVALWPYLWHSAIAHFKAYWAFHANHVHYNFEYLGVNYNHPPFPWHEPFGMLITTAPVVLLVLAAAGAGLLTALVMRLFVTDPREKSSPLVPLSKNRKTIGF
jgi:sterol desaturase/sphingolipid hydroxylase (fatty acid hydroxylase superfamily)